MSDSTMSIGSRQASFGPPLDGDDDDLVCRNDSHSPSGPSDSPAASSSTGHSGLPAPSLDMSPELDEETIAALTVRHDEPEPDYRTTAVSVTFPFLTTVGASISSTVDRFGQHYWGVSMSVGIGVGTPIGVSETSGNLIHAEPDGPAPEQHLRDFLCGDSVSVTGGVVANGGLANSSGGTAVENGVATSAQIGLSFGHNWSKSCPKADHP